MEEYEIRQLFYKKGLSKLKISGCVLNANNYPYKKEGYDSFVLAVLIKNTSNHIEKNYKTVVYLKNLDEQIELSTPREQKADIITNPEFTKISLPRISPIFQNETLIGGSFFIDVPFINGKELLNKIDIEIDLLYTNGTDYKDYSMKDFYIKNITSLNKN